MERLLMKFGCTEGQAAARAPLYTGVLVYEVLVLAAEIFLALDQAGRSTARVITSAWPFAACWTTPTKEGEAAAPARTSTHKAKGGTKWNRPKQAA